MADADETAVSQRAVCLHSDTFPFSCNRDTLTSQSSQRGLPAVLRARLLLLGDKEHCF